MSSYHESPGCTSLTSAMTKDLDELNNTKVRGFANGDCTGRELWFDFSPYPKNRARECLAWMGVFSYRLYVPKEEAIQYDETYYGMGRVEIWQKDWSKPQVGPGEADRRQKLEAGIEADARARGLIRGPFGREPEENATDATPDVEANAAKAARYLQKCTKVRKQPPLMGQLDDWAMGS